MGIQPPPPHHPGAAVIVFIGLWCSAVWGCAFLVLIWLEVH